MRIKTVRARVKATGDDTGAEADGLQPGQFTALVSVFGNEDSVGDVVVPGAFTQTLADWKAKGDPIPVIWSHDWGDPFSHIGVALDAQETAEGLLVTGQVEDLDTNPTAQQVYRLLKGRRVTQFSFAYDVLEGAWVETEPTADNPYGEYYELRKLKLYEVGPCLVGANQETELVAAKAERLARGVKEGRVLAQQHLDRLKDAHTALGEVIDAADSGKRAPGPVPAPAAGGEKTPPASPGTEPGEESTTDAADTADEGRPGAADDTTTPSTGETAAEDHREAPEGAAKSDAADLRMRASLALADAWATDAEE